MKHLRSCLLTSSSQRVGWSTSLLRVSSPVRGRPGSTTGRARSLSSSSGTSSSLSEVGRGCQDQDIRTRFEFIGFVNWQGKEVRGKLELLNFSEDIDDLELNVNVLLDPPCSEALRNVIKKGAIIADIQDTLAEYVTSIQAQYGGKQPVPSNTTVHSKTIINNCKPAGSPLPSQIPAIKKTASKRSGRKNKKKKSGDFLFYLSLISIVGFSAVIAIKIVNRL